MKILVVVNRLNMGGIENMLLASIPFYKEKDVEVHILCNRGGSLEPSFAQQGVTIHYFKYKGNPIFEAASLYSLMKKVKYDVVHCHYSHNAGFFALISSKFSVPFALSVHSEKTMFKMNWDGKPLLGFLRKTYLNLHRNLTLKYASKIIGQSKTNLKYYTNEEQLPSGSIFTVVYNGIDFSKLDQSLKLSDERADELSSLLVNSKKVFMHIGSFREPKNHSFLIDVFKGLYPKENGYRLILLGVGVLWESIKNKVKELDLEEEVLFVGMETNIRPYLEVSDVFFFPSLHEGFGNVLIESQYCKVPVCASSIKAHYESVHPKFQHYFFSPTSKEDAIKKVLNLIENLDSPEMLINIEESYSFAKVFSIENMTFSLIKIYNDLK